MDGVLAEVSGSYRQAIVDTAAAWDVTVTPEQIEAAKAKGNANNDWVLTRRFLTEAGKTATLEEVTDKFEELYQGTPGKPGLCTLERLIPAKGLLEELNRRLPHGMGIVTGRPRKDCDTFLKAHGLQSLFRAAVCMDDGPPKPDPFPVRRCAELMGVDTKECILIGDTPDDIKAVVAAGGRGVGVRTPLDQAHMYFKYVFRVRTPLDQAHSWLDGKLSALAESMRQAGAIDIIEPGCAALLDLVPPRQDSEAPGTKRQRTETNGARVASISRKTNETKISVDINLDGTGKASINTGLGFLDHMLHAMAKHGRLDLTLKALGARAGIARFGNAFCPLDEALARAVVDISSRPHADINLMLTREMIGTVSTEMLPHVLESFAQAARITLHVDVIKGFNCHHKAESAFKATGVALRHAIRADATAGVPSTKGVLA
ncbi:imidazoleglycerol-phosphate dehydratase [Tribonema minus]|uniref:Imidazoleglycerol-phosphate dehydratase n=1 Tax=Tribonema minus TaxID=303371 RepID=A0A835YW16_9STRA|nr:imidazoleglycerol-phosphate dehydratase [Tribonema minus]